MNKSTIMSTKIYYQIHSYEEFHFDHQIQLYYNIICDDTSERCQMRFIDQVHKVIKKLNKAMVT